MAAGYRMEPSDDQRFQEKVVASQRKRILRFDSAHGTPAVAVRGNLSERPDGRDDEGDPR